MEISKYKVQLRDFDKLKSYLGIENVKEWFKQMNEKQKILLKEKDR